jgi:hypothetical protein
MDCQQGTGHSSVTLFAPHSPHLLECAGLTPFDDVVCKSPWDNGLRAQGGQVHVFG